MIRYPIAPNGIFKTVQGEGLLLGTPMVFVRLAGCSIGCPQCDTDYRVAERLTAKEIGQRIASVRGRSSWVWVTGGEPADHDLRELLEEMRLCGRVALATSGHKSLGGWSRCIDFLSVSPHCKPSEMVIIRGAQLNLVPGLNGLNLADWHNLGDLANSFGQIFVTPCDGSPETLAECMSFIDEHPYVCRLGVQAHKHWGLP